MRASARLWASINHPELINTSEHFLEIGLVDFVKICDCLPYAQRDDEVSETRQLNGGLIGLKQRPGSIALWKHALGVALRRRLMR